MSVKHEIESHISISFFKVLKIDDDPSEPHGNPSTTMYLVPQRWGRLKQGENFPFLSPGNVLQLRIVKKISREGGSLDIDDNIPSALSQCVLALFFALLNIIVDFVCPHLNELEEYLDRFCSIYILCEWMVFIITFRE